MSQTDRTIDALRRLDLLGAYLYGSAVEGGLKPRSDIDILAVLARPTIHEERRRLSGELMRVSGRYPPVGEARPLEVTLVVESAVNPWHYPPQMDFQYGEWLRAGIEQGDVPAPRVNPDLTILLTQVMRNGEALFGPEASNVLDAVPASDVTRALVEGVAGLVAEIDGDTTNSLLTLARTWFTLHTGEITPKDVAAEWAASRLPDGDTLSKARASYLGDVADDWATTLPMARACARQLVDAIRCYESG